MLKPLDPTFDAGVCRRARRGRRGAHADEDHVANCRGTSVTADHHDMSCSYRLHKPGNLESSFATIVSKGCIPMHGVGGPWGCNCECVCDNGTVEKTNAVTCVFQFCTISTTRKIYSVKNALVFLDHAKRNFGTAFRIHLEWGWLVPRRLSVRAVEARVKV